MLFTLAQHADQRWFALYNDVQYENIAVTHYGQVYLIDYEHLSIIQNTRTDDKGDKEKDKDKKEKLANGEDAADDKDHSKRRRLL